MSDTDSVTSSGVDILDPRWDEGYEDVNKSDDEEKIEFKSLFDDSVFGSVDALVEHERSKHDFDLPKVIRGLKLDDLEQIQLVNYIRSAVRNGDPKPDVTSKEVFTSEKYLQPVLEDDALLYSLEELLESSGPSNDAEESTEQRLSRLERMLEEATEERDRYARALGIAMDRIENASTDAVSSSSKPIPSQGTSAMASTFRDVRLDDTKVKMSSKDEDDEPYWEGYAKIGIHKTMLQDEVRTEAYRDFIYKHRHLFEDKAIMDVGCGTGILSMFCASVGARHVYAVDASDIIKDARKHVEANGFKDKISLYHGQVEKLKLGTAGNDFSAGQLPEKVDIIISEWMGYCLLQENMLPSVLYARDNFLVPGGLLAPSHCTLHIAPLHSMTSAFKKLGIGFWNDVYGFDMSNMATGTEHREIYINTPRPDNLASKGARFKTFDLLKMETSDVIFGAEFSLPLEKDIASLDAFMVWFDTFFLTSPSVNLPEDVNGTEDLSKFGSGGIAFTTGPFGKCTHWGAGHLPIKQSSTNNSTAGQLIAGDAIKGRVTFGQYAGRPRDVEITVQWEVDGKVSGKQRWFGGDSFVNPPSMDADDPENGGA